MNIRNATLATRHRKNAVFEQEHAASLDYDKQRDGGTPSKGGENGPKPKPSKTKKAPSLMLGHA